MNKLFVKVCGITTVEQIDWAIDLGYDAIGIMRHEKSPRYCDEKKSKILLKYAQNKIQRVTVGLTLKEIGKISKLSDFIQVYEDIEGDNIILAGAKPPVSNNFAYFLYDTSQGSGVKEEFPGWLENYKDRLILAGGLDSHNVSNIMRQIRSRGIDVSSGVEKERGIKDYSLMKAFIDEVRNAK